MMDSILSSISLKSLTSSVTLPVHEPISFGFEDLVKAKAEADAAVSAEIERQLAERAEMALGVGMGYKSIMYCSSVSSAEETLTNNAEYFGYICDYNTAAELSVIKRRKSGR